MRLAFDALAFGEIRQVFVEAVEGAAPPALVSVALFRRLEWNLAEGH